MRVLGIESSCDETGVAIYDDEKGLLDHAIHTQIPIHAQYGGVVPELAGRDHIKRVVPLIRRVCDNTNTKLQDLSGIAYTAGPGLIGALLVGAMEAKALAFSLNIPAIAVHHMEGHLLAPMLESNPPQFPFVALLVSGGHTMLIKVSSPGVYELLGQSMDDAAGEAFDKTAKLLSLPYPGGPKLEELARLGTKDVYKFPRPMIDRPNLDFSFAGLKTAVLNAVNKSKSANSLEQDKANIARGFEDAVADTLVSKCEKALKLTNYKTLVVAGGVSANTTIRNALENLMHKLKGQAFFARREFCTDNGAMIALAGLMRLKAQDKTNNLELNVYPRWSLSELSPLKDLPPAIVKHYKN